jgi:hypothetical protein
MLVLLAMALMLVRAPVRVGPPTLNMLSTEGITKQDELSATIRVGVATRLAANILRWTRQLLQKRQQ